VPETAIHKDAGSVLAQHDVRTAWQAWVVYPVPKAAAPQKLSDYHLRLRILAFDGCHVVVALL
jgi:hypothetical protein